MIINNTLVNIPIKNLSQAKKWAESTSNLPSYVNYKKGIYQFLKDSKDWHNLPDGFFLIEKNGCWKHSSDGAFGGLDASWSFYKVHMRNSVLNDYLPILCKDIRKVNKRLDKHDEEIKFLKSKLA